MLHQVITMDGMIADYTDFPNEKASQVAIGLLLHRLLHRLRHHQSTAKRGKVSVKLAGFLFPGPLLG